MKKSKLSFLLLINTIILFSNPYYLPEIYLEEFIIRGNLDWEMWFFDIHDIDSIRISSSTHTSIYVSKSGDYILVTNDSLNPDVSINPEGDSITIISYFSKSWSLIQDSLIETIVFDNYPNSTIPKPTKSQSIVRILETIEGTNYHCIRDSLGNRKGILSGKIYDKTNNIITSGSFYISPYPDYHYESDNCFDIKEDGTYSYSLYSLIYNFETINLCEKHDNFYLKANKIRVTPFNFIIEPDTLVYRDIHLIDDLVDIEENTVNEFDIIKIYPNPTSNYFNYNINIPVKSTNSILKLINVNGQNVWNKKITDNIGTIHLPSDIRLGIYILQLWINGKNYSSLQLVVD